MVRNAEIHCSVIQNSKFKHTKIFILYTIHIVCYIKKTKAKQKQNHQHNSILTTMDDLSDVSYIFFAFMVGIPKPDNT